MLSKSAMTRFLLCADLDRTVIPNGPQPESATVRQRFKKLACRNEVSLAYVTGRSRQLIEEAITTYDLPRPDVAIADVGTTIYQINSSSWQQWDHWGAHIAPDWCGLSSTEVGCLLNDLPDLQRQEEEKQNRHKLSFYLPLETNRQALFTEIDFRLRRSEIKVNLVWSVDEAGGMGLLDVLPAMANKLHAIRFLMAELGFLNANTVFAGDSGNDLDVLTSDIPSVLVANADPRIKHSVVKADPATLYTAQGGYLGMNGNYCAGVLEGIARYWPKIGQILNDMNLNEG